MVIYNFNVYRKESYVCLCTSSPFGFSDFRTGNGAPENTNRGVFAPGKYVIHLSQEKPQKKRIGKTLSQDISQCSNFFIS